MFIPNSLKPRYNPPKVGQKASIWGIISTFWDTLSTILVDISQKRTEPEWTFTDIARNNLESPIRWDYLCEPDWKSWFTIFENVRHCLAFLSSQHIAISVVYTDILVQPHAISGGIYLAGLKIATYLCR